MTASARAAETTSETITSEQKEAELRRLMRECGSVLVAYSGGVDSSYLAFIATQELGADAICVMGVSASVSAHQRAEAEQTARDFGFSLETIETNELEDERYASNSPRRCYFCKTELYSKLHSRSADENHSIIFDGTNADDLSDHRPGRLAADEQGVRSPLAELGFSKDDIRERSKVHGLPTWNRPASPCLSSRVAHGIPVTIERLDKIERAEGFLREEGFREFRVRVHGELARIEIAPDEMERVLDVAVVQRVADRIKSFGFRFVTLDLEGFRSGSMNETQFKSE